MSIKGQTHCILLIMGIFGNILGSFAGREIGSALGGLVAGHKGAQLGGNLGSAGGSALGNLAPFHNGGLIRGKRGNERVVVGTCGETILPLGCPVTPAQLAIIRRNKRTQKTATYNVKKTAKKGKGKGKK